MNQTNRVFFEQALKDAILLTEGLGNTLGSEIVLVRDLRGRIRPVLPSNIQGAVLTTYRSNLSSKLGVYGFAPERSVLFANEFAESIDILNEKRLIRKSNGLDIYLLDRQVIGQDWMRNTLARRTTNPRLTFYGIKGGVGRSTALVNWAWHLADQGKKVLVFDLDLESPGVSSSLLPDTHLPDYGIVDWFVEDGVGQANSVESEMLAVSPLAQGLAGEIQVISAYGKKTGSYMPKLSRCYAEFSGSVSMSWAERLQTLVERMEDEVSPDVVIFDSRAGLHDIAAVLATRMDADTLLFAIDTPQTWKGYSLLFQHWHDHPNVTSFRNRLQIIASMVPETGRENYLQGFKENAWDLFRDNLYDETSSTDVDSFAFDLDDESSPHAPVPIFWHRALLEFNPVHGGIDSKTASDALGAFFEQVDQLLATSVIEVSP